MIQTQQHIFAEATMDTEAIEDITDKIETNRQLFENNEERYGENPENDGQAAENAKSKRFDEKEWDEN